MGRESELEILIVV
jgi:hypothetical protein